MNQRISDHLQQALAALAKTAEFSLDGLAAPRVERARDRRHGDLTSNVALAAASALGRKPRELAQGIVERLPAIDGVQKVEIAGPGFINFFLTPEIHFGVVPVILDEGEAFGRSRLGEGTRVLVEFVSANPTGPLHIGHGRGAAYGATLSDLLAAAGYTVSREYYVNDAGRQMDILALSVWLRYLEQCGEKLPFPEQAYRGDYLLPIATQLHDRCGEALRVPADQIFEGLPDNVDPEVRLDRMIGRCKELLGAQRFEQVFRAGLDEILEDIRDDLKEFGVEFDRWYSERSLVDSGRIRACIERLRGSGDMYEKDGALWFQSSKYGDEKDRVVARENGQLTYFASDIAYHLEKFERGFAIAVDIWGADHHGYIARVKAALQALGKDPDAFIVQLVQFATLYRGKQRVQMSTRSGEFITLRELRREVGGDAARFFYVTRKSDQHLDFDLELAKSQSNDNPVYYIQYAHARICSILGQLAERGYAWDARAARDNLARLDQPHELSLATTLSRYPEVVEAAARAFEPHQVGFYLRELANEFHAYYNAHQMLVDDAALRNARVGLALCVRQVLRNGLGILGVSAPEAM